VDGVDVPEPMTFAYAEAELSLEPVSTFRSRLKDVSDEEPPRVDAHTAQDRAPCFQSR
jgi:hypothetical protein